MKKRRANGKRKEKDAAPAKIGDCPHLIEEIPIESIRRSRHGVKTMAAVPSISKRKCYAHNYQRRFMRIVLS